MAAKKPSSEKAPESKKAEPSSGTRKKGGPTIAELVAEFRTHAEGLDGRALEKEIGILMDHLVEKSARMVPEKARPRLREHLRGQLEHDPALRGLLEDLRAGVKRAGR